MQCSRDLQAAEKENQRDKFLIRGELQSHVLYIINQKPLPSLSQFALRSCCYISVLVRKTHYLKFYAMCTVLFMYHTIKFINLYKNIKYSEKRRCDVEEKINPSCALFYLHLSFHNFPEDRKEQHNTSSFYLNTRLKTRNRNIYCKHVFLRSCAQEMLERSLDDIPA